MLGLNEGEVKTVQALEGYLEICVAKVFRSSGSLRSAGLEILFHIFQAKNPAGLVIHAASLTAQMLRATSRLSYRNRTAPAASRVRDRCRNSIRGHRQRQLHESGGG